MNHDFHVGIDVSKLTFDAFVWEKRAHESFRNDACGFEQFARWLKKQTHGAESVLVCFEHTGVYSLQLAIFMEREHLTYAMLPGLQIKQSLGITRGKNDLVDSMRIAEFAYRFSDKIAAMKLPSAEIRKIHSLLTLRARMMTDMQGYVVARNEIRRVVPTDGLLELFASYDRIISDLRAEIKRLEAEIKTVIDVGFVIAAFLIAYTHNFTRFTDWRKFACYAGIAPFGCQSGTSVHGKSQVCSIANLQAKKMLHLAAMTAVHFDTELREYYIRRQKDGKSKMAIINIVRNKVIARVFAVMKRGTPFVDVKKYAIRNSA